MNKVLTNYEKAADGLAVAFLKELYPDENPREWYWVGAKIGERKNWGDWFVDTTIMADFFRYKLTSDEFFEWYDQRIDGENLNIMHFKLKKNEKLLKDF